MSITVYPHPSVELLRAVMSVFSHLGEASEVQLCAETESDLTLPKWGLKLLSLIPLVGMSLTLHPLHPVCAEWD